MSKKIAVIGECMIELSEKGADVKRGFGGDTLNTSVYIARQVDPAALTVHYVTALGTDSFSQQMLDAWHGENVDTSLTQRMENRLPGLYYIETDSTGERTFYYWRNEAAAKFWLESEQSAAICEELANFDYLYLSGISLAILSPTSREKLLSLLRECRANGGKVIFDNNYRPRLWASKEETQQVYQQMLECTDIAFLTLDDEDALWGQQPVEDVIARTHNAGVKEVVVKRGADSCLVSISCSLAALRRSSLYGAVRRKLNLPFSISKVSPPCSSSSVWRQHCGYFAANAVSRFLRSVLWVCTSIMRLCSSK